MQTSNAVSVSPAPVLADRASHRGADFVRHGDRPARRLILVVAAALGLVGSGCATLARETMLSELVNDHEPGTAACAQPRPRAPVSNLGAERVSEVEGFLPDNPE